MPTWPSGNREYGAYPIERLLRYRLHRVLGRWACRPSVYRLRVRLLNDAGVLRWLCWLECRVHELIRVWPVERGAWRRNALCGILDHWCRPLGLACDGSRVGWRVELASTWRRRVRRKWSGW